MAVLADERGRYLFIQRGPEVKRSPGWWCFVGGEVEPGEALEAAMAREVMEEVGLRVSVHEKVHECVSPEGTYLLHWFLTRLDPAAQTPVPHPLEVAQIRWLTLAEALRLDPVLPRLKAWLEARAGAAPDVGAGA